MHNWKQTADIRGLLESNDSIPEQGRESGYRFDSARSLDELMRQLAKDASSDEAAYKAAAMAEEELFKVAPV
jgi:hypothetical protein